MTGGSGEEFFWKLQQAALEAVQGRVTVPIRERENKRCSGLERDRRCCLGDPGRWCSAAWGFLVSGHGGISLLLLSL